MFTSKANQVSEFALHKTFPAEAIARKSVIVLKRHFSEPYATQSVRQLQSLNTFCLLKFKKLNVHSGPSFV